MRAAAFATLCVLAACGGKDIADLPSIHPLDAGYQDELGDTVTIRLFGTVREILPGQGRPALTDAEVCVEELFDCDRVGDDGSFVLEGEMQVGQLAFVEANAPGMVRTYVPFAAPVDGDRNLATVAMLSEDVIVGAGDAVGASFDLESSGLLLIAPTYFGGSITLEANGADTVYTDQDDVPSIDQDQLIESAIIANVAPGAVDVNSPLGRCDPAESGWPSDTGDFSTPIEAGRITFVQPLCIGE